MTIPEKMLLCIISMLLPLTAAVAATPDEGSTMYVTDELRLGLYEGELTNGRPFKTLLSGDRLEVLERALMSVRVRTADGEEGWVKTAYLVSEEPARSRAASLEEANGALSAQLAEALATSTAAAEKSAQLETDLAAAEAQLVSLPQLQQDNEALEAKLDTRAAQVPLLWLIVAVIGALASGAVIGYLWLDRKVRSRFGGIRVY